MGPAMRRRFDVCNGDADGLCAVLQWRLHEPAAATLVTGLKREIDLLQRVPRDAADEVLVCDLSMQRNRVALMQLLEAGVAVRYFDHHAAGEVPQHAKLETHLEFGSEVCTSLLMDRHLGGRHRNWAVVGAYGDDLVAAADRLAAAAGLDATQRAGLRRLGQAINYNAYGEAAEDVLIAPERLYPILARWPDPLDLIAREPIVDALDAQRLCRPGAGPGAAASLGRRTRAGDRPARCAMEPPSDRLPGQRTGKHTAAAGAGRAADPAHGRLQRQRAGAARHAVRRQPAVRSLRRQRTCRGGGHRRPARAGRRSVHPGLRSRPLGSGGLRPLRKLNTTACRRPQAARQGGAQTGFESCCSSRSTPRATFASGAGRRAGPERCRPTKTGAFEDGEHKVRPLVDPRGDDAYVVTSLHGGPHDSPHDKLCRLLLFIATLREHGAARVTAVVPYLAYARKDRQTKPFDPVTLRYVAQLFEAVGTGAGDRARGAQRGGVPERVPLHDAAPGGAPGVRRAWPRTAPATARWPWRRRTRAASSARSCGASPSSNAWHGRCGFAMVDKRRSAGVVTQLRPGGRRRGRQRRCCCSTT